MIRSAILYEAEFSPTKRQHIQQLSVATMDLWPHKKRSYPEQ
jgi:hypothetical protein